MPSPSAPPATAALSGDDQDALDLGDTFAREINTFGPDDLRGGRMPGYRRRVRALLTPVFAVEFDENVSIAEETVKRGASRSVSDCQSGIEAISAARSVVLVGCREQLRGSGQGTNQSSFRWLVTEARQGGRWLVDGYREIDAKGAAEPSSPTGISPAADQAVRAAATALPVLLSYDYRTLSGWQTRLRRYLTPHFYDIESKLFQVVAQNAPRTKSVVAASVRALGVQSLSADEVKVYAFLDQSTTNVRNRRPIDYQNAAVFTMKRSAGGWLVDDIQTR